MKNKFRLMVVAIIIAQSIWYLAPWGLAYPGQSAGALLWIGRDAMIGARVMELWGIIISVLQFVFYVGLLFFWNWARVGFLILCVLGGILIPLYGISVQSGYEGALGYFAALGSGVLIALSYSPGVREYFDE